MEPRLQDFGFQNADRCIVYLAPLHKVPFSKESPANDLN